MNKYVYHLLSRLITYIDFLMNYGNLSRDCWFLVGNRCTITAKFKIAATCQQLKTYFERIYNLKLWRDAIEREMWRDGLVYAAKGGRRDLINFFVSKHESGGIVVDWNRGLEYAALGGHRDLVDFFISKCNESGVSTVINNWNLALGNAAENGHRDLVNFFISKGANDWNEGLGYAAHGGHRVLVDFFILKAKGDGTVINWNLALQGAARGGHRDLVDFFLSKAIDDNNYFINWNCALDSAAIGSHLDLVELFVAKSTNTIYTSYLQEHIYYSTISHAAEGGNADVINLLLCQIPVRLYPKTYFRIVQHAAKCGHRDIVELYISKIEEIADESISINAMFKYGFMDAISGAQFELMEFFVSKGQNDWDNAGWAAGSNGPLEPPNNLSDLIRHHDMRKYVKSMRAKYGKSDGIQK